jgi:ribosomal protein S18 acetylase RimI-like enzyme
MADPFHLVPTADDAQIDAVYSRAFAGEQDGPNREFLGGQLATHRMRERFAFVGAAEGEALLGFAYGFTGHRGQWWPDHVAAHTSAELVDTWLGGHFEVVVLAVVPEARGRGVGAALMTALLADRPEPCALLGTWQHDSPARRLYERLGWVELQHDLDGRSSLYGRLLR